MLTMDNTGLRITNPIKGKIITTSTGRLMATQIKRWPTTEPTSLWATRQGLIPETPHLTTESTSLWATRLGLISETPHLTNPLNIPLNQHLSQPPQGKQPPTKGKPPQQQHMKKQPTQWID